MLGKLTGYLAALAVMSMSAISWAEEFKLPDSREISTFPPEALQFYNDGLKALDHVDYVNAYEQFAKASQLAPGAVRLDFVTAALALKQGRSKHSAEAKPYYETAINCYQNILKHPDLDEAVRRDAQNRLKIAMDERDNLAQRDVRREVMGNRFVTDLNRQFAPATPKPSPKGAATPAPAAAPAQAAYPVQAYPQQQGYQQQQQGGAPPINPYNPGQPGGYPQQQNQLPPANPNNPQPAI